MRPHASLLCRDATNTFNGSPRLRHNQRRAANTPFKERREATNAISEFSRHRHNQRRGSKHSSGERQFQVVSRGHKHNQRTSETQAQSAVRRQTQSAETDRLKECREATTRAADSRCPDTICVDAPNTISGDRNVQEILRGMKHSQIISEAQTQSGARPQTQSVDADQPK